MSHQVIPLPSRHTPAPQKPKLFAAIYTVLAAWKRHGSLKQLPHCLLCDVLADNGLRAREQQRRHRYISGSPC
ncbi:hypothetical protein [Roseibium sp.]|uniref:hypothetical protein n=1 Tax=Roseibium sp. TaxID=1936156 RepID=UPI003D13F67A